VILPSSALSVRNLCGLLLLTCGIGCGPSGPITYPVSGTVTFNGEPIPSEHNGYITFIPADPSLAPEAGTIKDGKFSFRATEGAKKVKVEASRFVGQMNTVMGLTPKVQYIPEKYNFETELTAEVTPDGENQFKFDLTDQDPQ
jgi:hypothetical protein